MKFMIFSAKKSNGDDVRDPYVMDFDDLSDAVKHMIDNISRLSNWSVLREDIGTIVYVPTGKIAAWVNFNSREVSYPSSWDWRFD